MYRSFIKHSQAASFQHPTSLNCPIRCFRACLLLRLLMIVARRRRCVCGASKRRRVFLLKIFAHHQDLDSGPLPKKTSAGPWSQFVLSPLLVMETLQVRSLWVAHLMSWTAFVMVLVWALAYQVSYWHCVTQQRSAVLQQQQYISIVQRGSARVSSGNLVYCEQTGVRVIFFSLSRARSFFLTVKNSR